MQESAPRKVQEIVDADNIGFTTVWETTSGLEIETRGFIVDNGDKAISLDETLKVTTAEADAYRSDFNNEGIEE